MCLVVLLCQKNGCVGELSHVAAEESHLDDSLKVVIVDDRGIGFDGDERPGEHEWPDGHVIKTKLSLLSLHRRMEVHQNRPESLDESTVLVLVLPRNRSVDSAGSQMTCPTFTIGTVS